MVILDDRAVILQRQRDAGIAGVAGALDQRLAAPTPDFLVREWLVDDRPKALGNVVGGELRMSRDSPPGQEDTQRWRPEIGRHADEVAHEADLGLTYLGHAIRRPRR